MKLDIDIRKSEKPGRTTKVYIFEEGETILENLENRHSRPSDVYRDLISDQLMEKEIITSSRDLRWSQKAGCSCGCSPGFIVDGPKGKEVYVTIKGKKK
jgi:hypothetical protein